MRFLVLLIILFGCAQNEQTSGALDRWLVSNDKIKVLSTTAMIDDLVGKIGGENVDRLVLIRGQIDPHSYELVKGDDEKLKFAQIVFSNGLGLEHGASLRYQLQNHPHPVFLGDEVQKQASDQLIERDGQMDPHVWMDISLWAMGIDPIVAALSEEDPQHREDFERRGEELREQMLAAHEEIRQLFEQIPASRRYLVTSHDAFHYFTQAYLGERDRCAAPEGLAPDGQLSSVDIARIVDYLCTHSIHVVFPESNVSKDSLRKIVSCCDSRGLKVRISTDPLYGDSMGNEKDGYLGMIRHNAHVLKKEWESD